MSTLKEWQKQPEHKIECTQIYNVLRDWEKENGKLIFAYDALAQLFVLCDSSDPKKVTLDTDLYNKAVTIIEEYDEKLV